MINLVTYIFSIYHKLFPSIPNTAGICKHITILIFYGVSSRLAEYHPQPFWPVVLPLHQSYTLRISFLIFSVNLPYRHS